MSFTQLFVHAVWSTQHRYPMLEGDARIDLCKHIIGHAVDSNIQILNINSQDDHIHVLFRLHSNQTVAGVIKRIKGESSWWANSTVLFAKKLVWARGYYARSVDAGSIHVVRAYINNQKGGLTYMKEIEDYLNAQH